MDNEDKNTQAPPADYTACPCAPTALRQVSVAVLLDNFMNHTIRVEEEEKRRERAEQRNRSEVLRGEERGKGG